jgi:OOP family OmpA-OmpF porin
MVALPRLVVWLTAGLLSWYLGPAAHAQTAPAAPAAQAAQAAQADDDLPTPEIGGSVGVHVFSPRSTLGAVARDGASIASSTTLGMRVGVQVLPLAAVEGELLLVPTTAREDDAALLVLEPRVQARLGGGALAGIEPFATVGLGLPMVLSSDRDVIDHDVVPALHTGVGVRIARETGWNLRADARTAILPARGIDLAAFDFELTLGLYRAWGTDTSRRDQARLIGDQDGDGVFDDRDACPERDEDVDGIDDLDGCPDIDDDSDEILDVADRCRTAAESRNGFRDDDGCPDQLPAELAVLVARPDALRFGSGAAQLRASARAELARVAKVLSQHDSVRVLIVGHTDDREAPDDAAGLSLRRAEAARDFLVQRGVAQERIQVWGAAAAHPRAANETSPGRSQNRRVTLQLLRADLSIPSQVEASSALP